MWFRHSGNDLEVSVIGTSDKVTVSNWYLGDAYHVEELDVFEFDRGTYTGAKYLHHADVDKLVQAMAAFTPPPAGRTTLPSEYQAALAPVIAANWHSY